MTFENPRPKNSHATRKRFDLPASKLRSAISNGSSLLGDSIDHRAAWVRRLRDLIDDHLSDLGGPENVSESEARLVRRAAALTLQLELLEARWAANSDGEASRDSLNDYQRASNSLRRILESLGLQRRAKTVVPSLEAYVAERASPP
jgi:hypothetical protein